jgi:hypothetical protein
MSLPPSEIPSGAMRFNSDSQKLEYWNGSAWFQVHTAETLQGGARGLWGGGGEPSPIGNVNTIEYVVITTQGNAVDFGDLTIARNWMGSCSSRTRGIWAGGSPSTDTIDYVTISSTGDAIDFGNLVGGNIQLGGLSNQTRGVFAGGYNDTLQYITIASTGDTQDFGNLIDSDNRYPLCFASPTRGIIKGGGFTPSVTNTIAYITIQSLGNAQDFGDLITGTRTELGSGLSNSIRGLFAGGQTGPATPLTIVNSIEYITIATLGNSQNFGDLTVARFQMFSNGCASPTRGLFAGGGNPGPHINLIESVQIMTLGNSVDFGDLSQPKKSGSGVSNAHGGL